MPRDTWRSASASISAWRASLARLEARVALEELLPRFASFERRDPRVQYVDSYLVRGPKRLPLRATAAPAMGGAASPG